MGLASDRARLGHEDDPDCFRTRIVEMSFYAEASESNYLHKSAGKLAQQLAECSYRSFMIVAGLWTVLEEEPLVFNDNDDALDEGHYTGIWCSGYFLSKIYMVATLPCASIWPHVTEMNRHLRQLNIWTCIFLTSKATSPNGSRHITSGLEPRQALPEGGDDSALVDQDKISSLPITRALSVR